MIQVISTGGTLDKIYCPLTGQLLVGPPVILTCLLAASVIGSSVTEVVRKDSLEMTDNDRENILNAVLASSANRILITHGTDTMNETAKCLADAGLEKTIVLTGAMTPHCFPGSDASFNIGVAFGAVQYLPFGVYIAMHGRVLPHAEYKKNRTLGRFE